MAHASDAAMDGTANTGKPLALLLRGTAPSLADSLLCGALDFFEVPWIAADARQLHSGEAQLQASQGRGYAVLTSAAVLAELLATIENGTVPRWLAGASSLYVYGFTSANSVIDLLRHITGDRDAAIVDLSNSAAVATITSDLPDLCGPMSGITVPLRAGAAHSALRMVESSGVQPIVSTTEGALFATTTFFDIPIFLDGSQAVIDLQQRCATYFDVKKQFAGAVPLVMYIQHQFRGRARMDPTNACLIIDDPTLQQRYGFLDYAELLQMMREHNFATTIAFIPWNYRRASAATVETFRQNRDRLSICIHGCDHIGAEFSLRSPAALDTLLKTAKQRMHMLRDTAGMPHDDIMVFPQGAFSPEAGALLKGNGFIAAVNTEVAPLGDGCNQTTVGDLWNTAILRYGEFPIFTRRYAAHGLENFAFDGLLEKPCFLVGHHEVFRDHARELLEFIDRLQSLNWKLRWSPIGDAVCRSYGLEASNGATTLRMFAERVLLENSQPSPQALIFRKGESDETAIQNVTVNGAPVAYSHANGHVEFRVTIPPGGAVDVRCNYRQPPALAGKAPPFSSKAKVAARRYLSEFRDNYLARNDYVLKAAQAARRLLK